MRDSGPEEWAAAERKDVNRTSRPRSVGNRILSFACRKRERERERERETEREGEREAKKKGAAEWR